ncbi:hypothetical protein A2U01_0067062, partial [Trifolium medium]|nr:hypothetical protein [Trifolium medium]
MDAAGRPKTESRVVNTKALLECRNIAETKLLLDNMSSLQERMINIRAIRLGRE